MSSKLLVRETRTNTGRLCATLLFCGKLTFGAYTTGINLNVENFNNRSSLFLILHSTLRFDINMLHTLVVRFSFINNESTRAFDEGKQF